MRETLLSWLPADLSGERILDAGCGTGVFSLALAARGAQVVGVDLSPDLVAAARDRTAAAYAAPGADDRTPPGPPPTFVAGDLLEVAREGDFTRAVVMDCFIHYEMPETLEALEALAAASPRGLLFTVAPWTPLLALMHVVGRLFRGDHKAPPIVPVKDRVLRDGLAAAPGLAGWRTGRSHRVASGFYISRGVELLPVAAAPTALAAEPHPPGGAP
jgi:magnesium-protoporphyrin O-methyltransferase